MRHKEKKTPGLARSAAHGSQLKALVRAFAFLHSVNKLQDQRMRTMLLPSARNHLAAKLRKLTHGPGMVPWPRTKEELWSLKSQ